MNEEMEVAARSSEYLLGLGMSIANVLVTPSNEAYVRLEYKNGSAGWAWGQTAFTREPITLSQTGLNGGNALVRVKVFGGIGKVDLQFSGAV